MITQFCLIFAQANLDFHVYQYKANAQNLMIQATMSLNMTKWAFEHIKTTHAQISLRIHPNQSGPPMSGNIQHRIQQDMSPNTAKYHLDVQRQWTPRLSIHTGPILTLSVFQYKASNKYTHDSVHSQTSLSRHPGPIQTIIARCYKTHNLMYLPAHYEGIAQYVNLDYHQCGSIQRY